MIHSVCLKVECQMIGDIYTQIVIARDLYLIIGATERFNAWMNRQLGSGFTEGTDYVKSKVCNY